MVLKLIPHTHDQPVSLGSGVNGHRRIPNRPERFDGHHVDVIDLREGIQFWGNQVFHAHPINHVFESHTVEHTAIVIRSKL